MKTVIASGWQNQQNQNEIDKIKEHLNASKVLKKSGTKKEVENDLLSCVAPQVGGGFMLLYAFPYIQNIYKYTLYQSFKKNYKEKERKRK